MHCYAECRYAECRGATFQAYTGSFGCSASLTLKKNLSNSFSLDSATIDLKGELVVIGKPR